VWSKVEANLKAMMELDNIIVRPGMTVGAWNVCRLPEIITELINIGVIKSKKEFGINYDNFFVNMLMDPKHYHVRILPNDFKKKIIEKLENFVVEFNNKYDTDVSSRFSYILHELATPFDKESAKEFVEITRQLDRIRDENTFVTIPEMNKIKSALFLGDNLNG